MHLADDADSQLNGQVLDAAWYLTRKVTGEPLGKLTFKEAFEIIAAKTSGGWDDVRRAVDRINERRNVQKT